MSVNKDFSPSAPESSSYVFTPTAVNVTGVCSAARIDLHRRIKHLSVEWAGGGTYRWKENALNEPKYGYVLLFSSIKKRCVCSSSPAVWLGSRSPECRMKMWLKMYGWWIQQGISKDVHVGLNGICNSSVSVNVSMGSCCCLHVTLWWTTDSSGV